MPSAVAGTFTIDVGAIDRAPQPARLAQAARGVVREGRRDLDAHVAVRPARALEHRQEDVGGRLNVLDDQRVDDGLRRAAAGGERRQRGVVLRALRDRLLEDGRIGGEADDVAVADHAREGAGAQQPTVDVVVPGRLAEPL